MTKTKARLNTFSKIHLFFYVEGVLFCSESRGIQPCERPPAVQTGKIKMFFVNVKSNTSLSVSVIGNPSGSMVQYFSGHNYLEHN